MAPRHSRGRWPLCLCALLVACAGSRLIAAANPRRLKSNPAQEYYVYVPENHDPEKRYWLFVAVHGLNGKGEGALGWAKFANEGDCIVVGPTFKGTYQFPSAKSGHGKNLVEIFKELSRQYKLRRKMFVTGFSAGAQFAHRFALDAPQLVVGCAAHSAGSWSSPSPKARAVPFVVTCGEDDTKRIDMAKKFADQLKRKRYAVSSEWYEGVGHSMCNDSRELTRKLFLACTNGMPIALYEKAQDYLATADKLIEKGQYADAAKRIAGLARSKRRNSLTERARATLEQIEKLGKDRLAEIDEQAKDAPAAAIAALEKMQQDFKGTRACAAAARKLNALKSGTPSPSEAAGKERPADVATPESKVKPEPKASPTASKAASGKAARWLSLAKNYIRNRMSARAARYLKLILRDYPTSAEAAEAKRLLDEL